jgi:hypothetical protein
MVPVRPGGARQKENPIMNRKRIVRAALPAGLLLGALAVGCNPSYENQRPPVDQLDKRDRGLQSKDVVQASDSLANDLLSLPQLNRSREQWTVVVDRVDDKTRDKDFMGDFNIFLQRLQTNLSKQGHGRVALIDKRDRFYDVRDRELERGGGGGDEFGQGGAGGGGPAGRLDPINPDYALRATAMDLPGRGTTYYNIQFDLVDLNRRLIVWTGDYEVRVAR